MSIPTRIFNSLTALDCIISIYDIVTNKCNLQDQIEAEQIQNEMEPLLNKANIRSDIIFVQAFSESGGFLITRSQGTNLFKKPIIFIDPYFYQEDKEACKFLIKREINHIKENHSFHIAYSTGILRVATAIFTDHNDIALIPTVLLSSIVNRVSRSALESLSEMKADLFAIKNSSKKELLGGRRFFIALKEVCVESNIQKYGDYSVDSLTSRIEKIEQVISIRRIEIDVEKEEEKIATLKSRLEPFISSKSLPRGRWNKTQQFLGARNF